MKQCVGNEVVQVVVVVKVSFDLHSQGQVGGTILKIWGLALLYHPQHCVRNCFPILLVVQESLIFDFSKLISVPSEEAQVEATTSLIISLMCDNLERSKTSAVNCQHFSNMPMNNHPSPIDKKFLKQFVRSELEPTWSDSKSSMPDMSWITPVVLDVLYSELMLHTRGNKTKAAKILGINRGNFSAKLKQQSRQLFTLDTVNDRV